MQYGICGDPEVAALAAQVGFEYFEWTVGSYLQPLEEEAAFERARQRARRAGLPCPAVNVFIPPALKITGPQVDWEGLERYVETATRRARTAGVEVIVFGSGGARRIPEGFPRQEAMAQLERFGAMAAQRAACYGVTLAVEPLNRQECNVLNTVSEAAAYVRRVGHPHLRLLIDAYHWAKEAELVDGILENRDLIVHAHIATPPHRLPPGVEPYDFQSFLTALRQARYDGRLSIEASLPNPEADLRQALAYLRRVEAAIGKRPPDGAAAPPA